MTAPPSSGSPEPSGAWAGPLGRAGARAAQILLVAAVIVGAVWLLRRVILVVVAVLVAWILAAAVTPLVRWLLGKGWPPLAATLLAFLGIVIMVAAVVSGVVLAIRAEWDTLVAEAGDSWQELQDWLSSDRLPFEVPDLGAAAEGVGDYLSSSDVASSTLTGVSAVTEVFTGLLLIAVLLFFFLKDGSRIANFTLRWFHGETRAKLAESIDRSTFVLGGYVRGTATVALVDAVLIGIGLAVLGVPLAIPLAVIVFVGAFIPVVGATVTGILAAGITAVTNGPLDALIVIVIVIAVNQLESALLQPVVMGRAMSLHPLIVLLALTIGTIVGGILGAILAVPYTALAWTLIQIWTDRYQAGDDPLLGKDPVDPRTRAENRATASERVKYQLLSLNRRRRRTDPGTAEQAAALAGESTTAAAESPGHADGRTGQDGGEPEAGQDPPTVSQRPSGAAFSSRLPLRRSAQPPPIEAVPRSEAQVTRQG
ncbi:AI-2E family transporter [Brachybacterium avium]|uniref:AI-2E family transporter n=1 Tax=Brachybacterium avium TaxID=2017485 RepID=A0A220UCW9_9MICO|nr:AI-2E family transporter [Brachybacterium avium]ASK65563.1 AI-2E family transporter [Brachybacterium avium]